LKENKILIKYIVPNIHWHSISHVDIQFWLTV